VTLVATAFGILADGGGLALFSEAGAWRDAERWRQVLLAGSGAGPIFRGSLAGLATAVVAARVGARPLAAREIAGASLVSAPTLGFASALLFQAWMIGAVCSDLGTADYLVALLADALRPTLLPVLLFVVAALVAFATGSSWSTMSILLPNAVPLAGALGASSELGAPLMVVLAIGAVLDGAIFGDHCSPISDTTVLSSVASGCDHLDHVRTQAPYAVSVALLALCAGHLPLLLGIAWPPGAGLLAGALGMVALLAVVGRPAEPATDAGACPGPELP
jgi:Na+/H+ antiporter NhaC